MKITKMTPSKRIPDWYYAELEDGTSLRVNVALIADYSLYTGRELTEAETESLKADAARVSVKTRALRIIGARPMSRKELTDRLVQKGETAEAAEEAVDWLESAGLLDDREYAGMVVRHYAAKGYGGAKLREEMYRRGVPKDLWEEALAQAPDPEEILDRLAAEKLRGKKPDRKEMKRITDGLLRRGYTWEQVRRAVDKYSEETEGFDEWQ